MRNPLRTSSIIRSRNSERETRPNPTTGRTLERRRRDAMVDCPVRRHRAACQSTVVDCTVYQGQRCSRVAAIVATERDPLTTCAARTSRHLILQKARLVSASSVCEQTFPRSGFLLLGSARSLCPRKKDTERRGQRNGSRGQSNPCQTLKVISHPQPKVEG